MLTINPKYITDQVGNKISVILSLKEFETMMEMLEDLEDVRLYDQVKNSEDPSIPIDEAFEMIDSLRRGK
jgi:PHD/YefM family antitoxin component YafN of YafNO toxin-antitoxin module